MPVHTGSRVQPATTRPADEPESPDDLPTRRDRRSRRHAPRGLRMYRGKGPSRRERELLNDEWRPGHEILRALGREVPHA